MSLLSTSEYFFPIAFFYWHPGFFNSFFFHWDIIEKHTGFHSRTHSFLLALDSVSNVFSWNLLPMQYLFLPSYIFSSPTVLVCRLQVRLPSKSGELGRLSIFKSGDSTAWSMWVKLIGCKLIYRMAELGHLFKHRPLQYLWVFSSFLLGRSHLPEKALLAFLPTEERPGGRMGGGERDAESQPPVGISHFHVWYPYMVSTAWGHSALYPPENKAPDSSAGAGGEEMRVSQSCG